jgi:hypothetical protein
MCLFQMSKLLSLLAVLALTACSTTPCADMGTTVNIGSTVGGNACQTIGTAAGSSYPECASVGHQVCFDNTNLNFEVMCGYTPGRIADVGEQTCAGNVSGNAGTATVVAQQAGHGYVGTFPDGRTVRFVSSAYVTAGSISISYIFEPCQQVCAGVCTDLTTVTNCGTCGNVCATGATCTGGACVCPGAQQACAGVCTDLTTVTNCGTCGNVCATGATCTGGACVCPGAQQACAGVCTDLMTTVTNCGTCGNVCATGKTCTGGACVCPGAQQACAGVCTDLTTVTNCGSCGNTCAAGSCCNGTTCVPHACPAEMVLVPPQCVCIDRYEASNGGGGMAASVAGAPPWVNVTWDQAGAACVAAGKRLCADDEWFAACSGPAPGATYPYGNTYGANTCNGADHGVDAAVTTGSMTACVGGYPGLYDMSGNVMELTSTCDSGGCAVRGGTYLNDATSLRCDSSMGGYSPPTNSQPYIGFRCCRVP